MLTPPTLGSADSTDKKALAPRKSRWHNVQRGAAPWSPLYGKEKPPHRSAVGRGRDTRRVFLMHHQSNPPHRGLPNAPGRATGHVRLEKRASGDVWFARIRRPDQSQITRRIGTAWTKRGRPPHGFYT